ncbi:4Fe-4S cluster-binding domain-containing protein [Clostridium perfringens]|uniref:anaerobic ribonucleoside-triphosphate reductase n=1 Tax=Clostridium perfringens TaxID=1502 RepID=UPI002245B73F|nr:anaerobic ribonucleoside-triphosphate reductase [Clostridium perfringens]MCX0398606.1 4Fe-4S cluster-binding domain-containing protein [Clostridium perfringens]
MCRAYLSPWFEKGGIKPLDKNDKAIFNGRANCGAITINTVKPAIKYKGNKEAYFKEVKRCFDLATEGHLWTYNRMKDVKASTNPLFFCEGGCHIKLKPEETIERAIKTFTWSYGYIGLNEASLLMTGKEIHEDNSFAIEVLEHFNKWKNEAIQKHGLLFAIYSTPAEGYAETCRNKDYEEFGLIPGVTDKKYYMNSFHVNVAAKINPFKKMEIEKPMFDLANGGHIVYTEYPINHNLEAISQSTRKAMKLGLYEGVNFDSITCKNCGKTVTEYDPKNPKCNHCGSTKLIVVDRVCGYLSYYEIDGSTRVNDGKYQENQNRVVHYGQYIGEGIQDFDILNGDGLRTTIWFKGCPHRCEGCHNQGSWEYDKNYHIDCDLVVETCKKSKKLSVLGGEPLAPFNIKEATKIVKKVKEEIPDCNIYLWTGYEWDEVKNKEIITYLDKIICGKFIKDRKCENPMYGSENQYIVDLK